MMRANTVIAALGNPLMADEGIGIRILEELQQQAGYLSDVEFVDLGSSAINAVHTIAGRKAAIFIDCAFMDAPPGTIKRFTPDEVASTKAMSDLSLHEGDLLSALALSRKLGECPSEVIIYAIEPANTAMGERLSPSLEHQLPDYVNAILREISLHLRLT